MSDERTEKKKPPYPPNHMLKQARVERDLTRSELAELIGLGDSKTIGRWERGMAFPSPIFRQRLRKIFQKDEEALGLSRKRLVDDEQETEESDVPSTPTHAAISETAEFPRNRDEFPIQGNDPSIQFDALRDSFMLHMGNLNLMHQNRLRMLDEVHSIWIEELLKKSLQNTIPIELELGKKPEVVSSPWHRSFQALFPPREHPSGFHILDAYEDAQGKLLILGHPGSGKTTLLLQLTRILLERARQNNNHPIPVIFSLASWEKQPITEWLVLELRNTYHISLTLSTAD